MDRGGGSRARNRRHASSSSIARGGRRHRSRLSSQYSSTLSDYSHAGMGRRRARSNYSSYDTHSRATSAAGGYSRAASTGSGAGAGAGAGAGVSMELDAEGQVVMNDDDDKNEARPASGTGGRGRGKQVPRQALCPRSMSIVDYSKEHNMLLRVVEEGKDDVEVIHLGSALSRSKSSMTSHLITLYGHFNAVFTVRHEGVDRVFSASEDTVICHTTKSGEIAWSFVMEVVTWMEPVPAAGVVIVCGIKPGRWPAYHERNRTDITALDKYTGRVVWTVAVHSSVAQLIMQPKRKLMIVGDEHGAVFAYNLKYGDVRWTAAAPSDGCGAVSAMALDAAHDMVIVARASSTELFGYSAKAHNDRPKRHWQTNLGSGAHPIAADNDPFVTMFVAPSSTVVAIPASGGMHLLNSQTGQVESSCESSHEHPYLCDISKKHNCLYSVNRSGGSEQPMLAKRPIKNASHNEWSYPLSQYLEGSVEALHVISHKASMGCCSALDHDVIVLVNAISEVAFVDAATGKRLQVVDLFRHRDSLLFVMPLVPLPIRGCDCGCGDVSLLSSSRQLRLPDDYELPARCDLLSVTDNGVMTLHTTDSKGNSLAILQADAPDIECCALDCGTAAACDKNFHVVTGHARNIIRWKLSDESMGATQIWSTATDGAVEHLSVYYDGNLVIAVITFPREQSPTAAEQQAVRAGLEGKQQSDRIVAYSLRTGDEVWSTESQEPDLCLGRISSISVCSSSHRTLVGTEDGAVTCFETKSGDMMWANNIVATAVTCVTQAALENMAFLSDGAGLLAAVNTHSGEHIWALAHETADVVSVAVSQQERVIVTASTDCSLRGWSYTGKLQWVHAGLETDDSIQELIVTPGRVIFRTSDYVGSCDVLTGRQLWLYDPPFGEMACMALDKGAANNPSRLFVGSGDGVIESLNVVVREQWIGAEETHTVHTTTQSNAVNKFLLAYGSRVDLTISFVLLLLETLQFVGLALGSIHSSMSDKHESIKIACDIFWRMTTWNLLTFDYQWALTFVAAWVVLCVFVAMFQGTLETACFKHPKSSVYRCIWVLSLLFWRLTTTMCVIPFTLVLLQSLLCYKTDQHDSVVKWLPDHSLSCWDSDVRHWVYAGVGGVGFIAFTLIVVRWVNVAGRLDRIDTRHRLRSWSTLFTPFDIRERENMLSVQSNAFLVIIVAAKVLFALSVAVLRQVQAVWTTHSGDAAAGGGAFFVALALVLMVLPSLATRPYFSHAGNALRLGLDAAAGWVFLAAGLINTCASESLWEGKAPPRELCGDTVVPTIPALAVLVFLAAAAGRNTNWRSLCGCEAADTVWLSVGGSKLKRAGRRHSTYKAVNDPASSVANLSGRKLDEAEDKDKWLRNKDVQAAVALTSAGGGYEDTKAVPVPVGKERRRKGSTRHGLNTGGGRVVIAGSGRQSASFRGQPSPARGPMSPGGSRRHMRRPPVGVSPVPPPAAAQGSHRGLRYPPRPVAPAPWQLQAMFYSARMMPRGAPPPQQHMMAFSQSQRMMPSMPHGPPHPGGAFAYPPRGGYPPPRGQPMWPRR